MKPFVSRMLIGGSVFFLVAMVLGVVTTIFIHKAHLQPVYRETAEFWRTGFMDSSDEREENMGWFWLCHKILFALSMGALYALTRRSLPGVAWQRGMQVGVLSWIMMAATYLGMWTAMALPAVIWISWAVDYLVGSLFAGAVAAVVVERWVPDPDLNARACADSR